MDLRNILGKLDQINEGAMSSAKKKPTGPKFVGKMKGTDPASAAKDKYVGGSMEESIFKELENTLQSQPARDLKREFAEFKEGQQWPDNSTSLAKRSTVATSLKGAPAKAGRTNGMTVATRVDPTITSTKVKRKDSDRPIPTTLQTETNVAKYADLGATNDTTHFIKNVTTGEIMSPHRSKADAEDALVSYYRGPSDGNKYKIVRARKDRALKEFAPGNGGGESGRWYTDDQITDLVGDGWWQEMDVSGNIPKDQIIQQAQAWLEDQGYNVSVLNVKVNDDDCEWYIEGTFHNPNFAKKGIDEDTGDNKFDAMMSKVTSKKSLHTREALGLMDELIHQGGASYREALKQACISFEIDPATLHDLYQKQSSSLDEGTSQSVEELAKHLDTAQNILAAAHQSGKESKYVINDLEGGLYRLNESVTNAGLGDFATDIVYAIQEAQEKLNEALSAIYGISEQTKSAMQDIQWRIDDAEANGINEAAPAPAAPAPGQQPQQQQAAQPGKPTLGADIGKPQAQQQQTQQAADQVKQQQDAAKQQIQQQQNIQKGVNSLKQAGAAVSNPSQTVAAFDKVADNSALTPNDKNNIASAGTVLGPIMGNQQLAGKFKDLVSQAGAAQQKQAQQQQKQAQQQPQVQQPQVPGATK